jgi:menaquinone-specific isochorismate synthase
MIAEHEGLRSRLVCRPIGWLGADGDGELMVALRCGLIAGRTATLFAGCGIVADSDPGARVGGVQAEAADDVDASAPAGPTEADR